MSSRNFFMDNDDLQFHIRNIDWGTLLPLVEAYENPEDAFSDPEEAGTFYADMLSTIGQFSAEQIAPYTTELDTQHPVQNGEEVESAPRMKTILDGLAQLGAMGLILPRRVGGLNLPMVLNSALSELLARGDVSVMTAYGFYGGVGAVLARYAIDEGNFERNETGEITSMRFDEKLEKIAAGEEWGAMLLTEPNAGSDLAQIGTKAKEQDDGTWLLNGQKIWITSGHGEHHIVLARSEDPGKLGGLKGLSLYYVPAHIEKDGQQVRNVEMGGLEEKMGQHSGVAATINLEDSVGQLIGQRGHGFRGMLLLMNNARILVGFESLGICEAAFRQAKSYAEERVTMGQPIIKHAMIADYLDEMEVSMVGLRALSFDAVFNEEMAHRLRMKLKIDPPDTHEEKRALEKEIQQYKRRARMSTPLIKYFGSEEAVRIARMNMQILGGVGYMKEYGAEKLLRDALILPVYEGTSQIQSLMALKDNMQKVLRNPTKAISRFAALKLEAVGGRDEMEKALARMRMKKYSAMQTIFSRIVADKFGDIKGKPLLEWKSAFLKTWDPAVDFSFGLWHAERLTRILSFVAISESLVRLARKTAQTDDGAHRRSLAIRFMERFEPKAQGALEEIEHYGPDLLDRLLDRKAE
jgi:alkylation response protein AidB-like acyl-CoA dehydrogenase